MRQASIDRLHETLLSSSRSFKDGTLVTTRGGRGPGAGGVLSATGPVASGFPHAGHPRTSPGRPARTRLARQPGGRQLLKEIQSATRGKDHGTGSRRSQTDITGSAHIYHDIPGGKLATPPEERPRNQLPPICQISVKPPRLATHTSLPSASGRSPAGQATAAHDRLRGACRRTTRLASTGGM